MRGSFRGPGGSFKLEFLAAFGPCNILTAMNKKKMKEKMRVKEGNWNSIEHEQEKYKDSTPFSGSV